jgi:glutamyl-tRNA synthetase
LIEFEDASELKEGEKITLMKWGNIVLSKVEKSEDGNSITLEGKFDPEDKDFKSTKKLNWLAANSDLTKVEMIEFDHLISVKKIDENTDFDKAYNADSRFVTEALADPNVKNL